MKSRLIIFIFSILMAFPGYAQFENVPVVKDTSFKAGIFTVSKGDTIRIEPIKYYKMKAGSGAMLSTLTYGIAKAKNKMSYKGKSSPNIVHPGDAILVRFGDIPMNYVRNYYMFTPRFSLRNFSLAKFSVKSDHRELITGEFSIWTGANMGVKTDDSIQFEVELSDDGTYTCKLPDNAPAGEYCLVFTDNGIGAYQSVFDFSVVP